MHSAVSAPQAVDLADSCYTAGQFRKACRLCRTVLQQSPRNAMVLLVYGLALYRGGKPSEGLQQIERSHAAGSDTRTWRAPRFRLPQPCPVSQGRGQLRDCAIKRLRRRRDTDNARRHLYGFGPSQGGDFGTAPSAADRSGLPPRKSETVHLSAAPEAKRRSPRMLSSERCRRRMSSAGRSFSSRFADCGRTPISKSTSKRDSTSNV